MADKEFEELRQYFTSLPQHIKTTTQNYTLVHDVNSDEDSRTSPPDSWNNQMDLLSLQDNSLTCRTINSKLLFKSALTRSNKLEKYKHDKYAPKLPDFCKSKKDVGTNLPEELGGELESATSRTVPEECKLLNTFHQHCFRDNMYSPCSDQFDSGNSTTHSPDGLKSLSPQFPCADTLIPPMAVSSMSSNDQLLQLELLEGTHRALHKFIIRHNDELELETGDPIYVQKEADDLWFEGINLRTGQRGIFPSAYVVDIEYNDFDPTVPQMKRERFLLNYLGSIETLYHKGNMVLCQAIHKIISSQHEPHLCILEVSDRGLRMFDSPKLQKEGASPLDYFYSLKNVSFCAFHPQDHRYMGFITKHPQFDRFACHAFRDNESCRPVTESIGRAFQRFYQKFIETAYPIEDIYIE